MSPPGPNAAARWLKALFLFLFTLYLLPFGLVRLVPFGRFGGSYFGPALDYPFTLTHADADILIFGDSSAVVGLDPRALSRELGLKVINLPNTAASLEVLGTFSLDQYLAHNRTPRLILLYFAPWNLDYSHQPFSTHLYEGEEILLRRGSRHQILAYAAQHPLEILNFPLRFLRENPRGALKSYLLHTDPAAEVAATQGYLDPLTHRPPQPEPCTFPEEHLRETPSATIASLFARYRTPATEVLLTLAPLPACTGIAELTARSYPGPATAPPVALPPAAFKDDFNFVHLRPEAVPANTQRVAALLRAALAQKAAAP